MHCLAGSRRRRLSPERGEEEDASEFDSVAWMVLGELASPSRSDKEAVPTCSRATVDCGRFSVADEVECGTRSVAEDADFASCPVAKVLDSVSPSVVKEVDSFSRSVVKELDSASGSEVEEGGCPCDPVCETYIR